MTPDATAGDEKLIQYLNEAYGKERELETALRAHISMTTRDAYRKRLSEHLKETQQQAKGLERRIEQLGGSAELVPAPGPISTAAGVVASGASKAVAAAKGPLHALRGFSETEKMLKNAKTEFSEEHEEIANYNAIATLAEAIGDKETLDLAKEYRRQEERMAKFLSKTIEQLSKQVAREEFPASRRNGSRSRKRSGGRKPSTRAKSARRSQSKSRSTQSKSTRSRGASSKRKSSTRSKSRSR